MADTRIQVEAPPPESAAAQSAPASPVHLTGADPDAPFFRAPGTLRMGRGEIVPRSFITGDDAQRRIARHEAATVAVAHRAIWQRKPILREVYEGFYRRLIDVLADVAGPTIELGSGPCTLKTFLPGAWCSDVVMSPWLDLAADGCALPLADASAANLVLVDVLHHLPYPKRFFAEAQRVLRPGGRLVVLDVYLSAASWPVYRWLHPEPATLSIRPLDRPADEPLFDERNPWSSDQGIAQAVFFAQARRFEELYPRLRIVHRSCFSTLMWPLSGGFEQKNRLPAFAVPLVRRLDRMLERFWPLTAYRCLVAVEKDPRRNR